MSFSENVNALSTMIRTIVGTAMIGAVGYGGGWLYTHYHPSARLAETERELNHVRSALHASEQQNAQQHDQLVRMDEELVVRQARIDRLDASLRLLKVHQRVGEIAVIRQEHDRQSGETLTDFRFVELDSAGRRMGEPRMFRIVGDLLYVDFWVVKFDDVYIEQADLDRSTSICLFRRLFGEFQEPHQGYTIDEVGSRPSVYGGGRSMSEFEERIWSDFWNIASDPQRAAVMGIRAAHGEAVSLKLRPGKLYRITLRASDGLSVSPPEDLPPRDGAEPL